ncbi:hypothetical protein NCAS_0F03940 [Naumovozyma castellii]|uniref:Uncharacterized protein n=1 Tax=Naumovozyma castellii TaxID=27288 RepID=G0VHA5_NAUCA|nr:hypothetical protein NCAS_0F03940 [Naumovozyma castellii CBS 4309]CCC70878.1 hypothetical protein NCAS_0F03940 [Naumovozyma castellii CBS 4309]
MNTPKKNNDSYSDSSELITPFKERALEEQKIKEQLVLSATPGLRRRLEMESNLEPLQNDRDEVKSYLRDLSSALVSQGRNLTKLLNEEVVSDFQSNSLNDNGAENSFTSIAPMDNLTLEEAEDLQYMEQDDKVGSSKELNLQEENGVASYSNAIENKHTSPKEQIIEDKSTDSIVEEPRISEITPSKRYSTEESPIKGIGSLSQTIFSQLRQIPSRPKIRKIEPVSIRDVDTPVEDAARTNDLLSAPPNIESQIPPTSAKIASYNDVTKNAFNEVGPADGLIDNEPHFEQDNNIIDFGSPPIYHQRTDQDNFTTDSHPLEAAIARDSLDLEPLPESPSKHSSKILTKATNPSSIKRFDPPPQLFARTLSNNIPLFEYKRVQPQAWSPTNEGNSNGNDDTNISFEQKIATNNFPIATLPIQTLQDIMQPFLKKNNINFKPYTWNSLQTVTQEVIRQLIRDLKDDRNTIPVSLHATIKILKKYNIIQYNATKDDVFEMLARYLSLDDLNEMEHVLFG